MVARAIYASRIPLVSGVGHETDVTISDLVADLRAPTPSAAAELVVPDGLALRQDLADFLRRGLRAINLQMETQRRSVTDLARRLADGLPDLDTWRRRVDDLERNMNQAVTASLNVTNLQVEGLEQRLKALDPTATLRRGYSVVQRADTGEVVFNTQQVGPGEALNITVSDGQIPAISGAGTPAKSRRRRKQTAPEEETPGMKRLL